jgi:hypothetical protein
MGGYIGFPTETSQEYYEINMIPIKDGADSPGGTIIVDPGSSGDSTPPTEPTDLNCYGGKVNPPFRSFDESLVTADGGPIDQACEEYVNGNNFPSGLGKEVSLDPNKQWWESSYLLETFIMRQCDDPNPQDDLVNQCKFAMRQIVSTCKYQPANHVLL